ncbi:hypothetical protein HER10_EVM0005831 [Colletotrichum scovillei]|uniref:uncharacterized protein n=1 Tax=Colletotrichum scovillei TaxID=1209932 RepID=UPI0015C31238|nr:uncharacterized protein HER10_EVM0005831 [Colletotrichum scovillei]KAF4777688.1 hypothetical protein HER10_EVM0005831 [Colletotrichum scovillei]
MAPKERPLASRAGGADPSRHRSARNDAPRLTHHQPLDDQHERQRRPVGAPPRRRIRSSRASGRLKGLSQSESTYSDVYSASQRCQSVCFDSSEAATATPPMYACSSAAFTQSRFKLTPESLSGCHASEIAVHIDDNTDGFYCLGCGIRRSDEQHKIRKFRAGDPAWRNFCKPCHEKHLSSSDGKTVKAYGNFCFGCGFARSSHFNKENPIKPSKKPTKNFCAHCMKCLSKRAVIPTETLLGSSSAESDTESDLHEFDADQHGDQHTDHASRFRTAPQQEKAVPKKDATDCFVECDEYGNESDELSPSESVQKRLRKRRSARASDAVPLGEVQPKSQCSTTRHNDDLASNVVAASTGHMAPSVEDVPDTEANLRPKDDMPADSCSSSASNHSTSLKAAPATPVQTISHAIASDGFLNPGPPLDSGTGSPSKRARFSERVEVRTSPTFWQREHPEGDNPYAQFQYEQYIDDLRDGKKAIPLKDPLRDPDGRTAGRLYVPLCSIDDHSFNSWSNEGAAGWDDFAARFTSNSTKVSGNNPLHSSTLYASGGNLPRDCSTSNGDQHRFTGDRSNPNNRQKQPQGSDDFCYGQGKENQPCPPSPIAPTGWGSLHGYFDDNHNFENHHASDWSSRRDARRTERNHGPCANQNGSFRNTQEPYRNCDYQADGAQNHFDSFSGYPDDYDSFERLGFDSSYDSNDHGRYSGEDGFHHGNYGSASAHQQYYQGHQSTPPKEKQHGFDFGASDTYEKLHTRSSYNFSGHTTNQDTATRNGASCSAEIPFESSTASNDALQEPKLPPIGIVMEIPDDMSDSDVHTLLIPGCDDYVPMAY